MQKIPNLKLSRSWTTRARRPGEADDSYVFVTRTEFERAIAAGQFFEWAEFLGNLYGTPVPEALSEGDILLEIDIQGARQVREKAPEALIVLLLAPSFEEQRSRMLVRGDDVLSIESRILVGASEIDEARAFADHEVVNDDVPRAVCEIASIIESSRSSRPKKNTF